MSIVKSLHRAGIERMLREDKAAEATKSGTLRGGNSGIMTDGGIVAGKCQRLSYLRYKGINVSDTDASRKLMFRSGISNEELWLEVLTLEHKGTILTEEEIPTSWQTDNGIAVTGRPDIVLCSESGEPEVGIELKQICSVWTARDVLFEGRPKFDHLVQAAHYSWQLGIPFELWYTSRVDWHGNDILDRCLPKYGTDKYNYFRDFFQESYYRMVLSRNGNLYKKRISEEEFKLGDFGYSEGKVNAGILKILPFTIGYVLSWGPDNFLTYTNADTEESSKTIISKDNISRYYNFVASMDDTKNLGPRPITLKGDGTKANYSNCSYCPLNNVCDKYTGKEKGSLDGWVRDVKAKIGSSD